MKKQKIIITIMTLLAVTLIVSPSVWAKNDNNSGVPFQALWDAINILQAQIDAIELIPGPPGEPGESGGAKVITQVKEGPDLKTIDAMNSVIGTPIELTITEPTDIVVLFTAEVVSPFLPVEGPTGGMWISLMCHEDYMTIVSEEWYEFSGNAWINPKQQANIHSVIKISEPGHYYIEFRWGHLTSGFGDYRWTMNEYRKTLIIP